MSYFAWSIGCEPPIDPPEERDNEEEYEAWLDYRLDMDT